MKSFLLVLSIFIVLPVTAQHKKEKKPLYVGTYTKKEGHVDGKAEGIYLLLQDPKNGSLEQVKTVAKIVNPSFVRTSPNGEFLFAVSELGPNEGGSGFIYSFKINEDLSLKQLSKLSTEAFAPAHVEVDKTGNFVFVSNYVGGVVMVYKVLPDGTLEKQQKIELENPKKSHAHSVTISKDNQTAYVADLGNDRIWIFDLDTEKGKLTPHSQEYIQLEPGTGPRHFTMSENGQFAWSINELNSTVSGFQITEDGGLNLSQTISTLPEDFSGKNYPADIHLHPLGKTLFVSNRGHNSIASFQVDSTTGLLKPLEFTNTGGDFPRGFTLAPDGQFLYVANQNTGNLVTFEVSKMGKLKAVDTLAVKTPVSLEFRK